MLRAVYGGLEARKGAFEFLTVFWQSLCMCLSQFLQGLNGMVVFAVDPYQFHHLHKEIFISSHILSPFPTLSNPSALKTIHSLDFSLLINSTPMFHRYYDE